MWKLLAISLLCLSGLAGCTKPSVSVVVVPNDRMLEPVYTKDGQLIPGRTSISDGWFREIIQDLENCANIDTSRSKLVLCELVYRTGPHGEPMEPLCH